MTKKIITILKTVAIALIFLGIALLMNSCSLFNTPEKNKTANDYIYSAFQEWYLWYDQIPKIDPNDYETQKDLINAIKVPQDRWSFSGSYTQIMKLLQGGEYTGFGAGFMLDSDDQLKISMVYKNSPLGRLGVQRGWIVNSINGYGADNLTEVNNALGFNGDVEFVLTDSEGIQHTETIQRETIVKNTVLYTSVIEKENHKIGYLVFDQFLEVSDSELRTVFEDFQGQNLTDIIVDLRYNGGGLNTIANEFIGMLGGDKVAGQEITKMVFNDKKTKYNTTEVSHYDGPKINLDKIYFITTSGTASSSELVINCLTPFMDVKLVGSETHGKPVGFYIIPFVDLDLAIAPVCFKNVNKDSYGDFYNGLPVHISEVDDLSHNWGDSDEKMLKAAIDDILGITAISSTFKSAQIKNQKMLEYQGIYQLINAY